MGSCSQVIIWIWKLEGLLQKFLFGNLFYGSEIWTLVKALLEAVDRDMGMEKKDRDKLDRENNKHWYFKRNKQGMETYKNN